MSDIHNARELEQAQSDLQKAQERKPTHRHIKTGGEYSHYGHARVQTAKPLTDMDHVEVYEAKDGTLWVRPTPEFVNRFSKI